MPEIATDDPLMTGEYPVMQRRVTFSMPPNDKSVVVDRQHYRFYADKSSYDLATENEIRIDVNSNGRALDGPNSYFSMELNAITSGSTLADWSVRLVGGISDLFREVIIETFAGREIERIQGYNLLNNIIDPLTLPREYYVNQGSLELMYSRVGSLLEVAAVRGSDTVASAEDNIRTYTSYDGDLGTGGAPVDDAKTTVDLTYPTAASTRKGVVIGRTGHLVVDYLAVASHTAAREAMSFRHHIAMLQAAATVAGPATLTVMKDDIVQKRKPVVFFKLRRCGFLNMGPYIPLPQLSMLRIRLLTDTFANAFSYAESGAGITALTLADVRYECDMVKLAPSVENSIKSAVASQSGLPLYFNTWHHVQSYLPANLTRHTQKVHKNAANVLASFSVLRDAAQLGLVNWSNFNFKHYGTKRFQHRIGTKLIPQIHVDSHEQAYMHCMKAVHSLGKPFKQTACSPELYRGVVRGWAAADSNEWMALRESGATDGSDKAQSVPYQHFVIAQDLQVSPQAPLSGISTKGGVQLELDWEREPVANITDNPDNDKSAETNLYMDTFIYYTRLVFVHDGFNVDMKE